MTEYKEKFLLLMTETIVLCCGLMNIREEAYYMWYVIGGMAMGIVVVAVAEYFVGRYA